MFCVKLFKMKSKSEIGGIGEEIACEYLVNKKYALIERNFRRPWGEIDIIAREKHGKLVFIEVKTMQQHPTIKPEDNLTKAKLKKLQRTAMLYTGTFKDRLWFGKGWQIDLVAIMLNNESNQLTNISTNVDDEHFFVTTLWPFDVNLRHLENISFNV